MCTDFRSFILTFSEMALILLRAPIILWFQVSIVQQSVYSAKMQSASLREMMSLFSSSNGLMLCKQMIDFLHRLLFYKVFKVIVHTNGKVVL